MGYLEEKTIKIEDIKRIWYWEERKDIEREKHWKKKHWEKEILEKILKKKSIKKGKF